MFSIRDPGRVDGPKRLRRLLARGGSTTIRATFKFRKQDSMAINLGDTEREATWRQAVRDFIESETPAALRSGGDQGENSLFGRLGAIKEWRDKVAQKGWI